VDGAHLKSGVAEGKVMVDVWPRGAEC
jgi:hypothetical protein